MLSCRLLLLGALIAAVNGAGDLGIPGTTQTLSGYDTELGEDPICWRGRAADNFLNMANEKVTMFPNKLVENFVLLGETELRLQCPNGTYIKGYAPEEFGTPPDYLDGIRPRAGEWYNYRVTGSIDLRELDGNAVVSDKGTIRHAMITVQVLMCELGQAGFCSPFIHEQSNARMQANNITQKVELGDRHGGTHVHSQYVFVNVSSTQPVQTFDVEVPMLVNEPGDFFAICALNLFTSDFLGGPAQYRHDVGNALDTKLISYQSQATILHVSDGAKIFSWVCSGLASIVILFLLFQTIKHRKNRVIQLSQGTFLIIFLLAAIVASASVFLLDPKNDVYCNLVHPMILIPLQLLYGVTIARLWRINAVISPLLSIRMEPQKRFAHRFVDCISKMTSLPCLRSKGKGRNLRRSVSDVQLALVVFLFTLPQAILQALSLALQPNELVVDFNSDESTGRATCEAFTQSGTQLNIGQSLETYTVLLLLVTLVMLMVVTTQSRNLPSLFNETRSMYDSTLLSILILLLGVGIIVVTDAPTTSPDVEYIVWVSVILCITLNTTLRIMLPKLKLVWRGETVVVSRLVSDYNAKRRRKNKPSSSNEHGVSGFTPKSNINPDNLVSKPLKEEFPKSERITELSEDSACEPLSNEAPSGEVRFEDEATEEAPPPPLGTPGTPGTPNRIPSASLRSILTSNVSFKLPKRHSKPPKQERNNDSSVNMDSFVDSTNDIPYVGPPTTRVPIVITDDETPTRRLVLPMFELQRLLEHVNRRITSGSVVPHEEWVALKESCEQMGTTFQEDVQFEWEDQVQDLA